MKIDRSLVHVGTCIFTGLSLGAVPLNTCYGAVCLISVDASGEIACSCS